MRYIFTHQNCPDGFCAAFVAFTIFGHDDTLYIPVQYGDDIPDYINDGDEVFIMDFSYPRDVLVELAKKASVLVLDHHQTAQKDLEGLSFARFDMKRSGARLALDYFYSSLPKRLWVKLTGLEQLVDYVMDRDLWLHQLPFTHEVSAAISSYPKDFVVWKKFRLPKLIEEGKAILRFKGRNIQFLLKNTREMKIAGYTVPTLHSSLYGSDLGNELCKIYPDAPFAAIYYDKPDGTRKWSLRSTGFDVSEIAKRWGGGGHQKAAGLETRLPEDFPDFTSK